MQRKFDIDGLRKIGFVVKSNFKGQIDTIRMKDGSKFKVWVGDTRAAHVAIKGVEFIEIDKEFDTGLLMGGEFEYMGTLFDFKEINPRNYGHDLELV